MLKIPIIIFVILQFMQSTFAQTNLIIDSTFKHLTIKPTVEFFNTSAQINAVYIYDMFTVVSLKFINKEDGKLISITSNTTIKDHFQKHTIIPILEFEDNEIDKIYTIPLEGENNINLIFSKIPAGIEKIDLAIPFNNFIYEWKGVTINNPNDHPKTDWTEQSLMAYWEKYGVNSFEGIYEGMDLSHEAFKYKLAVKKEEDNYQLIFLSGSFKTHWKTGEIKAYTSETATASFFKAKWFSFTRILVDNIYIQFGPGLMEVIWTDKNRLESKSQYLKLYPTANNIAKKVKGSGTGFALTPNGMIVTNHHVIENATSINIRGINGNFNKIYKAKVLLKDKNNDLAILQIEDDSFTTLGKIPYLIDFVAAKQGSGVFVLGYPLPFAMGQEIKLTNGIISSTTGFKEDITIYQISAPIQPGNSGGPVFDNQGKVIGIINSKLVGGAENVSYAIKTSYLRNLIELLDDKPNVQGVSSLDGKTLSQQVEIVKKFVYIIEIN